MTATPSLTELRATLESVSDGAKAPSMAAYMKGQFAFLGVTSADRRKAAKPVTQWAKKAEPDDLLAFAEACWAEPEREFQYVAVDALRAGARTLRAGDLDRVRNLIVTKSWWDTVDALAAWVVGPMVANHPELVATMDRWIDDPDMWLARTAILHQLGYKERADADRLFGYADKRVGDTEFFIRKALGWALRQHARVDPDAVWSYLDANADRLSGLTIREAAKHRPD